MTQLPQDLAVLILHQIRGGFSIEEQKVISAHMNPRKRILRLNFNILSSDQSLKYGIKSSLNFPLVASVVRC